MDYMDILTVLSSIETIIILAIVIMFITGILKLNDTLSMFLFFPLFLIFLISFSYSVSATIVHGDFDNEIVDFDDDEEYDLCSFDNCTIYLLNNWASVKTIRSCTFNNTVFYSNITTAETMAFVSTDLYNCSFEENVNNNKVTLRFDTQNNLTFCNFQRYDTTDFFINIREVGEENTTMVKYFTRDEMLLQVTNIDGHIHFYQLFNSDDYLLFDNPDGNEGTIFWMANITLNTNYDYVQIYNHTHGLYFNLTDGVNLIDVVQFTYGDNNFTRMIPLDYTVSGWLNGTETEYDNMSFTNTTYILDAHYDIDIHVIVKNSDDETITDLLLSVQNNETGESDFFVFDRTTDFTISNGTLFFYIVQTEYEYEARFFELTLSGDTSITIYLNDSIALDKAIIDYQYDKEENLFWAWNTFILILIVVLIGGYLAYKALGIGV